MKPRADFTFPPQLEDAKRRARHLAWATIGAVAFAVLVVGATMGQSQAMRTAWVEDLLSFIPPISFLVARRVEERRNDERFPYGRHRAASVAYLGSSLALTALGLLLLGQAVLDVVRREHPTIGTMELPGVGTVWAGWAMMVALPLSTAPILVLGLLKLKVAERIHDKTLHTDALMNKADWMTGVAGTAGVAGVGMGWWWADALAAGIISLDILFDGFKSLKRGTLDLMDERPTTIEHARPDPLIEEVERRVRALPWVTDVGLRLREEGRLLTGEVFLRTVDEAIDRERVAAVRRACDSAHWRVHDVAVSLM